jgi:diaminohydroxyphosphoribosylaminopyrimidine deaminase/5-amino-6-(5-phosphoribosylamino)uracil reductase
LLEEQARTMNEAFACWILTHQPFVTLKSALTLDGQLAWPQSKTKNLKAGPHNPSAVRVSHAAHTSSRVANSGGAPHRAGTANATSSAWITSEESRAEVHRMRHASDALLTGIGTILADDPLLTDRSGLPRRRRLLRVILDSKLKLTPDARIVKTADDDLLVVTSTPLTAPRVKKLLNAGVEVFHVPPSRTGSGGPSGIDLNVVLAELGRRDMLSVLLEAGPRLNGAALTAGVVHKLVLFYAPKIAGGGATPFAIAPELDHGALANLQIRQVGPDLAVEGYLKNVYRNH